MRNGTNLRYVHQDSLGSTSVVTNSSGGQLGYSRYYPYGSTRDYLDPLDTNRKFTSQRLDATGLYYYGARYYDPTIGRFISADTAGPNPADPQTYNKYSYCFNNPLAYVDPAGNWGWKNIKKWVNKHVVKPVKETAVDVAKAVVNNIDTVQTVLDVAGMVPVVGEAFDAANGVIYAVRGDEVNAALSFAACVPVPGRVRRSCAPLAPGSGRCAVVPVHL